VPITKKVLSKSKTQATAQRALICFRLDTATIMMHFGER
jgi:hypothetical protein